MKNLESQRQSTHNSQFRDGIVSSPLNKISMYGYFRISDVIGLTIRNWLQQLPYHFSIFFAIYPAMWQLTSLLSSDKATLSVKQFIKSISCNKCSIFSLLLLVSLTLLSISLSPTKNLSPTHLSILCKSLFY